MMMDVTMFSDVDRLIALGIRLTFDGDVGKRRWINEDQAFTFLYRYGKFVIGPVAHHIQLYAVHCTRKQSVEDARKTLPEATKWLAKHDNVAALGWVDAGGKVDCLFHPDVGLDRRYLESCIEREVEKLLKDGRLSLP